MRTLRIIAFSTLVTVLAVGATALSGQAPAGQEPAGRAGGAPGRGGPPVPPKPRAGHPSGKLVLWGDTAKFVGPGMPENCFVTNRFKRGDRIGFRMVAFDGGSGEPENTAMLVAHLKVAGNTVDIPLRWRGNPDPTGPAPQANDYNQPITNLFTGWWLVPADATASQLSYTVTATDQFGRTATFEPFSYGTSQLTIIE